MFNKRFEHFNQDATVDSITAKDSSQVNIITTHIKFNVINMRYFTDLLKMTAREYSIGRSSKKFIRTNYSGVVVSVE